MNIHSQFMNLCTVVFCSFGISCDKTDQDFQFFLINEVCLFQSTFINAFILVGSINGYQFLYLWPKLNTG